MIQNRIYYVSIEEIAKIKQELKHSISLHLAEIQGKNIQSWEDYIGKMEEIFKLPTQWTNTLDGYSDWMRDLEWLGKDGYVLIIYDHKEFLEQEPLIKRTIMNGFISDILPWWQEEVVNCVVEGKAKPFNVYLVD